MNNEYEVTNPLYTISNDEKKWVIDFVFVLYYHLIKIENLQYYTLPFPSTFTLNGNGFDGWETNDLLKSFGFGDSGIMKYIAPGLSFTTTPIWKGV
jgi:hypothetical protein